MNSSAELAIDKLRQLGIEYDSLSHEAAFTMAACLPIERALGAPVVKNLLLTTRNRDRVILFLTDDKPFVTGAFSRAAGTSRLSFAPDDMMLALMGASPGSLSPLGLMFDEAGRVRVLIDEALREQPRWAMHPCDNTQTLALDQASLLQVFLPATGHPYEWISV